MKLLSAQSFDGRKYSVGMELVLPIIMDLLANLLKSCFPQEQPSQAYQRFTQKYSRTARTAVAKAYREAAEKQGVRVRQTEAAVFANEYLSIADTLDASDFEEIDITPEDELRLTEMI